MGQVISRRKKATCLEQVHEQQPCVLLKHTTTAENRQLDETPGGADANNEGRDRRFRPFRKRAGKYDLVKAEEEDQSEAGSYWNITDGHASLQHLTVVEIPDHQEAPASEVLRDAEEQLEKDVIQPQDVDAPVHSAEDDRVEELGEDQPSLPHTVEMHDSQEAPASEVLPDAEEQLEKDVIQPQDVDAPVRSAEDDRVEELGEDQPSLPHTVEMHDSQEAPASEVLPDAEEQLEKDVIQPQDVDAPVRSAEDDRVEELGEDQPSLPYTVEIRDSQEAPASEVLADAEEQLEKDVIQPQDVESPVCTTEDDTVEELNEDQSSLQILEISDLGEAPASEVLPDAEEQQKEQDVLQPQDVDPEDDDMEDQGNDHICWRYEFGQKLGQGGFGSVYAGTRCKDGLKVALKIAEKTPDMRTILVLGHPKRLPMEIGLTFMANKGPRVPQIIKLLDWQDDPDHYIMVLERPLPCMNLLDFIKLKGGCLDERTAKHVMQQVIHAANICCERGVFHRDIKLENLLINQDTLEVKLIDFGCGALLTESGYVTYCGTKIFCPPEYHANGKYHAKPATVWSLGILLFVMMCGYYPSLHDLQMISKDEWCEPDLSQECYEMIRDSLQPDPEQRLVLEEMKLHDWFKVME